MLLQLEELKTKLFGKRKERQRNGDDDGDTPRHHAAPNPRTSTSYRRPVPTEDAIPETKSFLLDRCTHCRTALRDVRTVTRYQEDILPPSEWHQALKRVTAYRITTGYCPTCRKQRSLIPIPKQLVAIGTHVREFVAYADVILRFSFEQIHRFLSDTVRLSLSDGEMAHILTGQAQRLLLAYERLKTTIRAQQGVHYDESAWKVQSGTQGDYGWVMTGTETRDTIFLLGKSRGKGNAEDLRGTDPGTHVGISDDYGAYTTCFTHHQLCWAHPVRKLRDLASSAVVSDETRLHCTAVYESFRGLYREARIILAQPFVPEERTQKKTEYIHRWDEIVAPHINDPIPLQKIKARLRERKERYFTCFAFSHIPPDNNKAERAIRHLVLKRKSSFGSKTERGAATMSVLCSILLSLWWKNPSPFFKEYAALVNTA